jgi:MtN3 and saliva related transmembrane protein
MAEFFGIVGGVLNTVRLFPQVIKSWKTKKTQDLSGYFILILFLQSVFLIAYGLTKPDEIIMYTNIVPLICALILARLKALYS